MAAFFFRARSGLRARYGCRAVLYGGFGQQVQVMLPSAEGGFNEPPSGHQRLDSGLHCGHGKLQDLTHVGERREGLVPLVGAAAQIAVDGKVPHG